MPLRSVLVTNGDIDHVAGLLTLREQQEFDLFATGEIHAVLADNPMFDALKDGIVMRRHVALGQPHEIAPGLQATLFSVPGKVPLYLEGAEVQTDLEGEQTVGVHMQVGDDHIYYIPGCAAMTDDLRARLQGAALVFFDGTLWQDDEMVRAGLSQKTGKRMGHMSMSGPDGSMAAFADMDIRQKVFVHMNNTNPVLRPTSEERKIAQQAGWTIAHDGLELTL